MGVQTNWHNEQKTVVMQVYEGKCDAADFHTSIRQVHTLVQSVPHTVDVIVDMRNATFIGTSFLTARGTSEAKVQSNQRLAILVGASTFIKSIVHIGKKVAPKTTRNIHFASSLEEANKMIARISTNPVTL